MTGFRNQIRPRSDILCVEPLRSASTLPRATHHSPVREMLKCVCRGQADRQSQSQTDKPQASLIGSSLDQTEDYIV